MDHHQPGTGGAQAMTIQRALLLGALLGALSATAQTPAPAPAAPNAGTQPAVAPGLGRLFFTPAERAQLDEMRRRPAPAPQAPVAAAKPEPPAPPPPPKYVTLNGVVRRSDGVNTVWLNDKPVRDRRSDEGLVISTPGQARSPGQVTVQVPQTGRSVELKVGQQVEINSGEVQEGYEAPTAAAAANTRSVEPPPAPSSPRRSSRERDLLRDLLREMEGPQAPAASTQERKPAAPQ
jgi:hypothetical protein